MITIHQYRLILSALSTYIKFDIVDTFVLISLTPSKFEGEELGMILDVIKTITKRGVIHDKKRDTMFATYLQAEFKATSTD